MGPPGPARAPRPQVIAEHFGIPRDLHRRHLPRQRRRAAPTLGHRGQASTWTPASTSPTRSPTRWSATGIDEADAAPGFLLDGYPRTSAQVDELDGMLARTGHALDAVVELTVDERRGRRSGCCKRAETEGRADDTEDVIRRRQEVYAEQTAPLIEVYRDRGLLVEVDGMGEVDEVTERIFDALDARPRELSRPPDVPRPRHRDQDARADRADARRRAGRRRDPRAAARRGRARASPPASSTRSPRTTSAAAAASPSFLGYGHPPFPATICASVNDEVVHGIPGDRVLPTATSISIDCGAIVDGWHGDAAITVAGRRGRRRGRSS